VIGNQPRPAQLSDAAGECTAGATAGEQRCRCNWWTHRCGAASVRVLQEGQTAAVPMPML
jgi:hypothetical protein